MSGEIAAAPEYRATMDRLEKVKHVSGEGVAYWFAREVYPILGYLGWREFEGVINWLGIHFAPMASIHPIIL